MTDANPIRPMFKARYSALRRSAAALSQMMTGRQARDVTGLDMADIRDEVESITQAFHEANAYHNAMLAIEQKKPRL